MSLTTCTTLDLTAAADVAVFTENIFIGSPSEGVLKQYELSLPAFSIACYYASGQKHDAMGAPERKTFPDGTNRCQPLVREDWNDLKPGGLFLLLKLDDGRVMAIQPLVGDETIAWFVGEQGRLVLNVGTLGTAPVENMDLPLLAYAVSHNVYDACEKVWTEAVRHPLVGQSTQLRRHKPYPEIFRYLGWCSWEQYYTDIDERIMLESVDNIEASGLPIRYMLVDDGHVWAGEEQKMIGFAPDPVKFPNGWSKLLSRRNPDKIKWFGLWLCHTGWWGGIHPQNQLGELNEHLEPVTWGPLEPKESFLSAFAYYDALMAYNRKAGFDFVKVDNQTFRLAMAEKLPRPVKIAANSARAMEAASAVHMNGLINCMAQNAVNVFNTRLSAVTRCSEDYLSDDLWRAKAHLHNSYGNILWIGQSVWGDHDMFHSNDTVAGRIMALSKSMSGAPIYLSDAAHEFVHENIWPVCYDDGELIRPLAPAAPLPDSVFINPFTQATAYRVIAPLPNGCAALVAYNLTHPTQPVSGSWSSEDYTHAGGMMQDGRHTWSLPREGLVIYHWLTRTASRLEQPQPFALDTFEDHYVLMCPVHHGWAVIGNPDKFLSPAAIEVIDTTPDELIIRMHRPGTLVVWSEKTVKDAACFGANLWAIDVKDASQVVRVRRG